MPGPGSVACPKSESRKRIKARRQRQQRKETREIRAYVFGRERDQCRCCRLRRADSMHELTPRSLGGKRSRRNSVAVCGDGVNGCHGFLQRHEITFFGSDIQAEDTLWFEPVTNLARQWVRLRPGLMIESPVMVSVEAEL